MTNTPKVLVAALDSGTTSTRCMLFDPDGRLVASTQREHRPVERSLDWIDLTDASASPPG